MMRILSDGRIVFLLGAITFAVVFAGVLIFLEFRVKRKDSSLIERMQIETPIYRMENALMSDKTPNEKLSVVDKTAKEYFNRVYKTGLGESYSSLVSKFTRLKLKPEAAFCKAMFDSYYLNDKLDDARVKRLGNILVDVENKRVVRKEIIEKRTFMGYVDKLVNEVKFIFAKKREGVKEKKFGKQIDKDVSKKTVDKKKKVSAEVKSEMDRIEKIEREYAKEKALREKLLREETRKMEKMRVAGVKNIVSAEKTRVVPKKVSFEEEFAKFQKENKGGIAERIVRTEKTRLDNSVPVS